MRHSELPRNFSYVHNKEGFIARLSMATTLVSTEFVAFLADDEFYLKAGLLDAIRHLDSDREIIGCVGRCLYFFVDQGRFLMSHAYRDWLSFPSCGDSLQRRLDLDLPPNKTHMAMYGIYRREQWEVMVRSSYSVPFSCGFAYERLLNLQRSVLGRTEILESLLWMRSKENLPVTTTEIARTNGNDFVSWATNPDFAEETNHYQRIASRILTRAEVSDQDAAKYIDRFFNGGVQRQLSKEQRSNLSIKEKLGRALLKYPPKRLRLFVKRRIPVRWLRFTGWEGYPMSEIVLSLSALGTRFDEQELLYISELSLALDGRRNSESSSR
jgi:hypothetical protein